MKIGMIELVSSHGGMNYYDFGLMRGLANLNNEITLYTSCELNFDIRSYRNLSVVLSYKGLFDGSSGITRFLKFIRGTIIAVHDIKHSGTQVVHFQIFATTFLECFVVWYSKKQGLKTIVTVHDVESFSKGNKKNFSKIFYKHVDAAIVHNNISYNVLVSHLNDIGIHTLMSKCYVIHHGSYIDLLPPKIEKESAKEHFGISKDTFVFLFFGQIKKVKGLDILLEAYAQLLKLTEKKVKLIIAGKFWKDDPYIYEKIIHDNKLSENIYKDIRYIDDEDVVFYYSAADCVVLPYRKIFQSGVLLMAQSYNTPVLVSDLPGMLEIVKDNENGFVFNSEDPKSLCDKMNYILSCKDVEKILENAYSNLTIEYNWSSIAEKHLSIINRVIETY